MSLLALAAPAIGSGAVIGFILALVGGGGSVLAVPLLVYVVGVEQPHIAIGTGALAVSLNALVGLANHARAGTVKWRCAGVFAVAGVAGALLGAALGKAIGGQELLLLFGLVMIVIGLLMTRPRRGAEKPDVRLSAASARRLLPRLLGIGSGVGLLAGFFGIGGGFLIVPGLIWATGMTLRQAVGTSLVAVAAFGLSTAGSYAVSGLVAWDLAGWLVLGGVAGSLLGTLAGRRLAQSRRALSLVFAGVIVLVGAYVVWRGLAAA